MDTTLADTLVGRVLDGRYRIQERIARGGMATVYRAVDLRLDRTVAVKVMHPALAEDGDFVSRFTREAKAAARLSHPNVVAVFDQGSDGGVVFLVMEYIDGATLRDLIRERGRLSPRQSLDVMAPVLSALAAAHSAGIVHRDIKPENVLIASDGRIKVADFGLARAIADSNLTATTGLLIGTAAYLAPEQIEHGTADPRTDLYAAGIVLYELLTGKPPYVGATPMAVVFKHVHEQVPAPSLVQPEIPRQIDALVLDATQREPADRPPTAGELLEQLEAAARTLPAEPLDLTQRTQVLGEHLTTVLRSGPAHTLIAPPNWPPPTPPPAVREPRRRPWLHGWRIALLLLVLVTLAAGATGAYFGLRDRPHHANASIAGPASPAVTSSAAAPVPVTVTVPDFSGQTADVAAQTAAAHQLAAPTFNPPTYSATVPKDEVASQDPLPNATAEVNAAVALTLSLGPQPVDIPATLVGMTLDQAKTALQTVGLDLGQHPSDYSDTVVKNAIISVTTTGQQVPGTKVDVVVSKGPTPVAVPDESAKTLADAQADLATKGFTNVGNVEAYSDTVDKGKVVSQTPKLPASVQPGTAITLVISKGAQLFAVPNLFGLTVTEAKNALAKIGMTANVVDIRGGSNEHVLSQDPVRDVQRPHGTVVTIRIF